MMTTDESVTGWSTPHPDSGQSHPLSRYATPSPSAALEALYARLAPWYDGLRKVWALSLGRGVEATIDAWILRFTKPPSAVLDMGCGTGANLARLLRLGRTPRAYVGVDSSPHMLGVARRRFGHLPQVTLRRMDIMDVDEDLGAFDLVMCTYALSHLREPARAVDVGLARPKPGGKAIFAYIGEPRLPLRRVIRPLEALLAFRPVPREPGVSPGRATELARYDGILMVALLFSAPYHGVEGR